jgi:hypothetical protein
MSKINSLTVERVRELLDYNQQTGIFTRKVRQNNRMKVGEVAGSNNGGYVCLSVDGKTYKAHRLAWFYSFGSWPENVVDHINGKKDDNRLSNLRDVTHRHNAQNRTIPPKHSSIGLLGVTKDTRPKMKSAKYIAQININGKHEYIGRFDTPEEAHVAYLVMKNAYHAGFPAQGEHHSFQ